MYADPIVTLLFSSELIPSATFNPFETRIIMTIFGPYGPNLFKIIFSFAQYYLMNFCASVKLQWRLKKLKKFGPYGPKPNLTNKIQEKLPL